MSSFRIKLSHSLTNFLFNQFRFPGSKKIGRTISKILLPKFQPYNHYPTIYGFDLYLSPGEGEEIFRLGFYEPGTLAFMKKVLKQGDSFLDIGASIGLMSFYASKLVGENGRVLTFEPVSKTFQHLEKSIELNQSKNITPLNFALGDTNTSLPINLDSACPSLATVTSSSTTEIVQVKILDEVLEAQKISEVKFVKIDVEGFEAEVLKGAKKLMTRKNPPLICLEFAPLLIQSENKFEAFEIIRSCGGYKFYQLTKTKDSISSLTEISDFKKFRADDNVFCIPENWKMSEL